MCPISPPNLSGAMASDLRRVSGRRLNFQKTQLEIRFNIPPRKSAVKNGVKNAVKKKVKNFSRETILKKLTEKSTEKFTEKSTDEFTGTSAAKIHGENRRIIPQKIQRRIHRKIHRRINQSIIDYVDSKLRGRRPGTWCRGLSWSLWLRWGPEPTMWSRCLWIAQQESTVPWPEQHLQTRKNCVPNRKGYGTKGGGEGLEVFVFL